VEKARQHSALIAALALAGTAVAEPVVVPSGLMVERIEVIWDADLTLARFRFLAPAIAERGFDMTTLKADFDALCAAIALPETRAARPGWTDVVLSMSSVAIPFGTQDPEVVQSFETYRLQGDTCLWVQF